MPSPSPSALRLIARLAGAAAFVVVIVAAILIATGGSSRRSRELTILAPSATWMRAGLNVRIAGQIVGSVVSAVPTRSGSARVVIEMSQRAWPLPDGTTATFRWPGAISFTNRYVQLTVPKSNGHWLTNGSVISGSDVEPTVELDQVLDTFNASTRSNLKQLLNETGPASADAISGLTKSLTDAPAALTQTEDLFEQLGADPTAMDELLRSGSNLVAAISDSDPGLGTLVDGAAGTFGAVASRSTQLQQMLSELPPTFTVTKHTLRHAERTLGSANRLLVSLSPGINQVRQLAAPLDQLLGSVVSVTPAARSTLTDLNRAAPDLNPLIQKITGLMPTLETVGSLGTTEAACIRPYAPEAAGFATNWDGFLQWADGTDKYARVNIGVYPYLSNNTDASDAQIAKTQPQLHYVFPAAPGEVAGQPWFNSKCGVGPDSLDASDNPEAK